MNFLLNGEIEKQNHFKLKSKITLIKESKE